jgi:hypothetical protein
MKIFQFFGKVFKRIVSLNFMKNNRLNTENILEVAIFKNSYLPKNNSTHLEIFRNEVSESEHFE